MTFVVATHNPDKAREMRSLLENAGALVKTLSDFPGAPEPEETGASFYENARIKALSAMRATGLASVADDSGLCVKALDGAPGVFSARFGGFKTAAERNEYLLRLMEGVDGREAEFACCVVCVFPDGREISAEGRCPGVLLREPRGTGGFGYDPLFFYEPYGKTMAEMTAEEKDAVSHRGLAVRALALKLGI